MPQLSVEHFHIPARNVRAMPPEVVMDAMSKGKTQQVMDELGFGFKDQSVLSNMAQAYAADSVQFPVTTPTVTSLVQFLQNWLPGQVHVMTAARKIDDLIGIDTMGAWDDEQIVQEVLENTGYAVPYGDYTNAPLSDWNLNFVNRTVVRFEQGMRVGNLEEARAARVRVNSGEAKRQAAGLALEIVRNLVGFNGYNSGADNTYGFLNDPGLIGYTTVANGALSSPLWSKKVFLEIVQDLITAIVTLRTQSKDTIDPEKVDITLALPTNAVDYLATVSQFGISVRDWLKATYPRVRVASAPQLNTANGGVGVFYLFAEKVSDLSTDNGRVWTQVVPAKFLVLGVQKLVKGYEEDYSNATAGAMCKRPFAVTQFSGIS